MRFLHTADWHVGKTLRRRQRLDEIERTLDEVIEIARAEQVDVALVCGDLFDQFAPSAEAERIVYRALIGLRETGASVLVIPGNHDNAKRFGAIERLSHAAGIVIVPDVRPPAGGGIALLPSRDGSQTAQIAALPWVPEKQLFGAEQMMGLSEAPNQAYATVMAQLLAELCTGFTPGHVHVLAAHLFVERAHLGGGERELTVGDLFAVTPQALPSVPAYIALGHVHRPQQLAGAPVPTRYAGSVLQLDFGEREQEKSVVIVDADPGRPATTRTVPLRSGRSLLDVTGTLEELRAREIDPDAWLRVILQCAGPAPGLADDVRELLPGTIEVRLDYEREQGEREPGELRRLAPRELFARYHQDRHGAPADDAVLELFDELLQEVTGEAA